MTTIARPIASFCALLLCAAFTTTFVATFTTGCDRSAPTPAPAPPQKAANPQETAPTPPAEAKPAEVKPSEGKASESTAPESTASESTPAASGEIYAVFKQVSGVIRVKLETKAAPRICLSFITLVEHGYFKGREWTDFSPVVRQLGESRVIFTTPREFSPKLFFNVGGRLCASNTTDDNTARAKPTRIFFTVKEQDRWNLVYSVFATVTEGLDVSLRLQEGEKLDGIEIIGDASALRAKYATELAAWNAELDAAGYKAR